jgi:hypothetical protein
MLGLFFGALLIAGAFTLLPGRIMGRVLFGSRVQSGLADLGTPFGLHLERRCAELLRLNSGRPGFPTTARGRWRPRKDKSP